MKAFFSNIWTKRVVSLIATLYTVGVCGLAYYAIFFSIYVDDRVSLCLVVSAVSVIALILMLYTRKQILTRISSFLILTAMLPVSVMYFSEKELIIPIVLTGIIILLLSGAGEGTKTVVGTIILLIYIFGALGYFLFTSFFITTAKTEIIEKGFSPSGKYRFEIVNTEDTSNGSTSVIIEPNYADVVYPFVTFRLKNMEHTVYMERPMCEEISFEWQEQKRAEITDDLNKVSGDIKIDVTRSEYESLGYTVDNAFQISDVNIYYLFEAGLTASDVKPIYLDSFSDEQLAVFDMGRDSTGRYYVLEPSAELLKHTDKSAGDTVYLGELDSKGIEIFNESHLDEFGYTLFDIGRDYSVPLKELTDEQLESLGISESGDVLVFNGKVCFRYYVAEAEDYFDINSRELSLDLLNPVS
ncbi:MAG: hypothetical protein NC340_04740 [Ruminococcus flavefaciens]|nr:hypothetical protein [Ruminococcus flavefaciens]MCM1229029.1 hypothetical protein [Ruminococcus flavefaciens]